MSHFLHDPDVQGEAPTIPGINPPKEDRMKLRIALGLAVFAALSVPAMADGDAAAGKKVFNKCKACHDVAGKNKVGPHLDGVIGRTAGTVEGFKYSDANHAAGAGGWVWTEEKLAEYLKDPKGSMPGNKMAFAGLKKDEDIANLIAYLKDPAAVQ